MKIRLLILLVFAAFMAGLISTAAYRAHYSAAPVQTADRTAVVRCVALESRHHKITETFYGLIEADTRLEMSFQITGRIVQLGPDPERLLEEGDRIEAGQLVARLAPQRYQAAVAEAEAQLKSAQAELAGADSRVKEALARQEDAKREHRRLSELDAVDATTRRELERAETDYRVAKFLWQNSQARRDVANAAIRSAEARLQTAQINLEDAHLYTPIGGLVATVPVEVGQTVGPGALVASMVNTEKVKLLVGVVERKVLRLVIGQQARVHLEALSTGPFTRNSEFREGQVSVIPPAADEVTGLFNVEIELNNADGHLRPGMIGRADVIVGRAEAVAIPAEAAIRAGDHIYAFFVPEGKMVVRRVVLKPIAVAEDAYLVQNIPDDAGRLVVEGQNRLSNGQQVTVIDQVAGETSSQTP